MQPKAGNSPGPGMPNDRKKSQSHRKKGDRKNPPKPYNGKKQMPPTGGSKEQK